MPVMEKRITEIETVTVKRNEDETATVSYTVTSLDGAFIFHHSFVTLDYERALRMAFWILGEDY